MFILISYIYLFKDKMNQYKNVLITGTNKGIGYELVKIFLQHNPDYNIYATSR